MPLRAKFDTFFGTMEPRGICSKVFFLCKMVWQNRVRERGKWEIGVSGLHMKQTRLGNWEVAGDTDRSRSADVPGVARQHRTGREAQAQQRQAKFSEGSGRIY